VVLPASAQEFLDEAAWANAAVIPVNIEFRPGENTPAPVETTCLLTYDDRALYAAFRAADPRPAEIRAHLSDRDQAFRDDNVGILLDTFDDQRRGFQFFVNLLGVQMDSSVTDISGGDESETSRGPRRGRRITTAGYEVEIAIPFTTLRFVGGDGEKVWGSRPRARGRCAPALGPGGATTAGCASGARSPASGGATELDPTSPASAPRPSPTGRPRSPLVADTDAESGCRRADPQPLPQRRPQPRLLAGRGRRRAA
jgi:hypothetical protein